jgi:hypothetical protein
MAFTVVLMLLAGSGLALAAPIPAPDAQTFVEVLDITGYPDDQDGDELYDGIQVVAKVNFTRAGDYTVHFKLTPADGSWWLSSAESQHIDKADIVVHFENFFEGWKIRSREYTGYLVAQVDVLNPATNALLSTYRETLGFFEAKEFESVYSGAKVTGFGDMLPLDFDGNGIPEILEVPVIVETTTPGLYRILMYYSWEPSDTSSTEARSRTYSMTNWSQLEAGVNEVPMWVSGGHIKDASTITFTVYVYKGAFPGKGYTETRTVISPDSWETPLLRGIYANEHIESLVDRDEDSLAEALRVAVKLDIKIPGEYTFTAVLGPEGTIGYDPNTQVLPHFERLLGASRAAKATMTWTFGPGEIWAFFEFDGRLLNAWGYDGAYDVYVLAYGPKPSIGTIFNFTTLKATADMFVHPLPPIEFATQHSDEGVIAPDSALFEGLRVTYNIKVNTPGTYTAFAILYHDNHEISYVRAEGWMDTGDRKIIMTFPGQAIHSSGVRGSFTSVLRVTGAGIEWNDTTLEHPMTARHVTSEYSYEMFLPPKIQVDRKAPQPVEDLDFILLRTGIMVVRVDRDKPDLTFYMTDDDGRTALFRVTYTRLLAFSDVNDDGAPQGDEIAYTSALLAYDWDLSDISLEEDPETGRIATVSLTTTVDLVENDPLAAELARPVFTIEDFAEITLVFTLSSQDVNRTDEVGTYSILGGAELKVDVHIDVLTPVEGIDFLTIEQTLKDDRGTYLPKTTEQDIEAPTPDELRRYKETQALKQRIEFRKATATPAFYSWVKKAEVTKSDGTEEVTDGRMLLFLSYPYETETVYIFHDPSLGIYESGFPGIPEEWTAVFDPLLYGVAAFAAVAVVTALRSRGGKEDEEDEEEGEEEGEVEEEEDTMMGDKPLETTPVSTPPRIPSPAPPPSPTQPTSSPVVDDKPEGWQEWKD